MAQEWEIQWWSLGPSLTPHSTCLGTPQITLPMGEGSRGPKLAQSCTHKVWGKSNKTGRLSCVLNPDLPNVALACCVSLGKDHTSLGLDLFV